MMVVGVVMVRVVIMIIIDNINDINNWSENNSNL